MVLSSLDPNKLTQLIALRDTLRTNGQLTKPPLPPAPTPGRTKHTRYCFYAVYQPRAVPPDATEPGADQASDGEKLSYGWSKPSNISCFTVTWKDSWGTPADPPT